MAGNPFPYAHRTALVTGASRGIGAVLARELARRGTPALALVARSSEEMDVLADELRRLYQTRVEVIRADLSKKSAPMWIKAETDRLGLEIDLLVNNAGFGDHGSFDARPLGKQEDMIAVNVSALVALTRLYLPGMRERGYGGILNIGSTAGFQPVPYMATYGATKAFVLSFSEALWAENRGNGGDVRVVCLCPGGTETSFGAVASDGTAEGRGVFEHAPRSTPEEVAKAGLDALDGNVLCAVVGRMNYVASLGPRFLPRSVIACLAASVFRPAASTPPDPASARAILARRGIIAGAAVAASLGAAVLLARRAGSARNVPPG